MRNRTAAFLLTALIGWTHAPAHGQTLEGGFDLAEYHFDGDNDVFIDGSLAYGGETHQIVLKLAAGGSVGQKVDEIEGQLLYSRAIAENFALLVGVKHEFRPHPHWTYAAVGIEGEPMTGLAVESYLFLSEKGDFLGESKAIYDLSLVKRVTLQPRVGLSYAFQAVPAQGLAPGLTDGEFGLRLRYELAPLFAPYAGVSHERLLGETADRARVAGEVVKATHFVVGFSSSF